MSTKTLALAGALVLAAGAVASANERKPYGPAPGGAIPDNSPVGFSSTIVVQDTGPIKDVRVTITGLAHTWVGDVRATLTHLATTVTLINRPGSTGTPPSVGDSSNLGGTYRFTDAGTTTIAAVALLPANGTSFVVPSGDYRPDVPALANFAGQDKRGDWTLFITDSAGADLGSYTSWSLEIFNVPTPGAAALFGLAGLAGLRRRR